MLIRETALRSQIRSLLKEAELKHSEDLVQKIYEFYSKWKDRDLQGQKAYKAFEIPAEQIIYDKNQIKAGWILYQFINQDDSIETAVDFLKRKFDPSKFLFDGLRNHSLEIATSIYTARPVDGRITMGYFTVIDDKPVISLNNSQKRSEEEVKTTIRHELQHLTQAINNVCIKYANQIKALSGKYENLKKIDLEISDKFGTSKQKNRTDFNQNKNKDQQSKIVQVKFANMEFPFDLKNLNYFADNAEYETWKSDFVDTFVKYLFEKGHITKDRLKFAANVKRYRNMSLKQIKDEFSGPQSDDIDKFIAKKIRSQKMRFPKSKDENQSNNDEPVALSINDLAGYMFNEYYIHNPIARRAMGINLLNFILAMKYLNKKEVFSDIFSHIEDRFEKIAKS